MSREEKWNLFYDLENDLYNAYNNYHCEKYETEYSFIRDFGPVRKLHYQMMALLYLHKLGKLSIVPEANNNTIFSANPQYSSYIDIRDKYINLDTVYVSAAIPDTEVGRICREYLSADAILWKEGLFEYIDFLISYISTEEDYKETCWDINYMYEERWLKRHTNSHESKFESGLSSLMALLLLQKIIEKKDDYTLNSLYIPFAGTGSFLFDNSILTDNKYFKDVYTNESNNDVYSYTLLKNTIYTPVNYGTYSNNNPLIDWPKGPFDAIVSFPDYASKDIKTTNFGPIAAYIIHNAIDSLSKDGIFIGLMHSQFLSFFECENLRKEILQKNVLDGIILLPSNVIYNSRDSYCLVVLSNNREVADPIRLMDASSFFEKSTELFDKNKISFDVIKKYRIKDPSCVRLCTIDDISKNGFDLNPRLYFQEEEILPEGWIKKPLCDLVEMIDIVKYEEFPKPFIIDYHSMLVSEPFEYVVGDDGKCVFDEDEAGTRLSPYYSFQGEAFVFWNFNDEIKFCKYNNYWNIPAKLPINIGYSGCYSVFRLTDISINEKYFLTQLISAYKKFYNLYEGFGITEGLPIENLYIVYPEDIRQQELFVREADMNYMMAKIQRMGYEDVIAKLKVDYFDAVRTRKHNMKAPMEQLSSSVMLIENAVCSIVGDVNKNLVSEIKEYLSWQKKAIDSLNVHIKGLTNEMVFGKPEKVEIEKALRELKPISGNHEIVFLKNEYNFGSYKIEKAIVEIAPSDFNCLVENIVDNAVTHGFTDENRKDYKIWINLSIEDKMFIIDFENNGNPFPEGLDTRRYGIDGETAGETAGTGRGGYCVKSIVEHYNGSYEILECVDESTKEETCMVRIKLPICFDYE